MVSLISTIALTGAAEGGIFGLDHRVAPRIHGLMEPGQLTFDWFAPGFRRRLAAATAGPSPVIRPPVSWPSASAPDGQA